jgi:hypothetical protein
VTLLPGVPRPKWVPSLAVFNVTQLDNRAVFEAFRSNADYFRKWCTLDLSMRPGLLPDH